MAAMSPLQTLKPDLEPRQAFRKNLRYSLAMLTNIDAPNHGTQTRRWASATILAIALLILDNQVVRQSKIS
jgi:hypothetical protein